MIDQTQTAKLTPMEHAMLWERMSGERLSDAERKRITDGGEFVQPTSQTTSSIPWWTTRKGQAEHIVPRPGRKPFQWRWMSLKEILGSRKEARS